MQPDEVQRLRRRLQPFFAARSPILFAYLFGSAARENTFRDLDFAIWCDRSFARSKEAFWKSLRWGSELERVLEPRRPVDLRLLNDTPAGFRHEVISTGVLMFERDRDTRVLFEARVLSEYMDYDTTRRFFFERTREKLDR